MTSNLTISKQIYLPNLNAGLTYDIDTDAAFGYTITGVGQIQTSAGTVTAKIQINGTAVAGLSSISVSSTPQNVSATGANTVSAANRVQIVFSSNSGATNINLTLNATRTAVSSVSNSDGTLTISPTAGDVVASLASLSSGDFLVGNGSNVATGVSMSGDATLANTGAVTIAANAVTNAKAAQMAAYTIKGNNTGSTANAADMTAPIVSGKMTAASFAPSTTSGVIGTTTNDNAAAGSVGEYISNSASSVSVPTSSTPVNLTSISLTAGDWDVGGYVDFRPAGTTTISAVGGGISTSSGTFPSPVGPGYTLSFASFSTGGEQAFSVPQHRISIASTTTVYLIGYATFGTSTMSADGFIWARRAR